MISEQTKNLLKSQYDKLPNNIKELIDSEDFGAIVSDIREKFDLNESNEDVLLAFSGMIIIGLIKPEELPGLLSKEFNLDNTRSESMASDIMLAIFSFMKIQEQEKSGSDTQISQSTEKPPTIAKESNEKHEDKEEIIRSIENPVPANLPIGGDLKPLEIPEKKQENNNRNNVPRYGSGNYNGQDPYREPIE